MKAARFDAFGRRPEIVDVPDPSPPPDGVVVEVAATGVCRSDWHGWMGHDPGISLPHVPGHEFAGRVVAIGSDVRGPRIDDRVTSPFVAACGRCAQCAAGHQQVCEQQEQPGFTAWGSFAEFVVVHRADINLVALPDDLDVVAAATLGCRFATSFRAVVDVALTTPGEWVAVHGCGGVGLSAVMIATAMGAHVVAVDIDPSALAAATALGAVATLDASQVGDLPAAVRAVTGGGAHVSLDAVGHPSACANSIRGLRTRGRHVQVGLLVAANADTAVPMDLVVARELAILGSHGMQAHRYDAMLAMIESGSLDPSRLVGTTVCLEDGVDALVGMDEPGGAGVTVITEF
ncbi:MAG TPA: zinc-dependent alcohol dehydrogenase family protein [Nitriliruptoraceae bacterium]|nr:zinc-dependent alcohol dehydrogenase family protein [Nitriliruptoraceae bacterium]